MKSPLLLVACATEAAASLATDLAVSGYRIRFAASGMELLKAARRLRPDLIVLDPELPDITTVGHNLNGIPWTRTIPRILLTSRREISIRKVPSGGFPDELRVSPFDAEELIRRVEEILGVAAVPPVERGPRRLAGEQARK